MLLAQAVPTTGDSAELVLNYGALVAIAAIVLPALGAILWLMVWFVKRVLTNVLTPLAGDGNGTKGAIHRLEDAILEVADRLTRLEATVASRPCLHPPPADSEACPVVAAA